MPNRFPYEGSYLDYHDQCLTYLLFGDTVARMVRGWTGKATVRLAFAGVDHLLPIAYSFGEYGYQIVGFFGGDNATGLHPHEPIERLMPYAVDVVFVGSDPSVQAAVQRRVEGSDCFVVPLTEIADSHRRTMQSVDRAHFATCLDARKLSVLAILNALAPSGKFVECGVYLGGGSIYVARQAAELNKRRKLYALDTFEGMPAPVEQDGDTLFQAGLFADNHFERVQANYLTHGVLDQIEMHKGLVQDTLPRLDVRGDVALALLDTDQYAGTYAGLCHVLPNLMSDGVVVVDDADGRGVSQAVDEVLERIPGFRRISVVRGFDLVTSSTRRALSAAA